jgi:hypothetical protein
VAPDEQRRRILNFDSTKSAIMKKSLKIATGGMILIAALAISACSEEKTNQIRISYIPPTNPEYVHIYKLLKEEQQTLEKLQEFLSPFRLPWTLEMSLTECDGEADAMYFDGKIKICYEYIDELWGNMPANTTAAGIEPIDTVVGPFLDTVLHEFAHALFDYFDVPVLGREEDAADQVAAYLYLQLGQDEAHRLIMGTVYTYMAEVVDTDPPSIEEYADEQSTSEQRAYNLMCIAYGADPELFKDVATKGGLPQQRVEICEEEYELLELAFETLIDPYIDHDLADRIFEGSWLPEENSLLLNR